MPWIPIAIGAGALLGGIAGAIPRTSENSSGLILNEASDFEKRIDKDLVSQYAGVRDAFALGPGDQDIRNALASQRSLSDLYGQYSRSGGIPGSDDIATARQFADDIFASQRSQLRNQFADQNQTFSRGLAASGRGAFDPVFMAKQYEQQQRAMGGLAAQEGSYASQLALALPQQKLGYATQAAQLQDALATQALKNRTTLLGLGSQLQQQERNWRLATATHYGKNKEGGGFAGFLSGALGGASAGINIASGIGSLGSAGNYGGFGGGGGGLMPMPAPTMYSVQNSAFSNSMQMPSFGSSFGQPRPYSLF